VYEALRESLMIWLLLLRLGKAWTLQKFGIEIWFNKMA